MSWAGFGNAVVRVVLVALAAGAVVTIGPASTASSAHRPLISVGTFRHTVSPNGDGIHDDLRIPFTVRRWASVSARVVEVDSGHVVYDGCVISGEHTCEFGRGTYPLRLSELRAGDRRPWEPGTYRVRLVARSYADVQSARTQTSFELWPGPIRAERREIAFSPNGDGVHDRARIVFALERRARVAAFLHPQDKGGPAGEVRLGVRRRGTGSWTWDGRVGGVVVPDGRYRLELRAKPVTGKQRKPGVDQMSLQVRTERSRPPV